MEKKGDSPTELCTRYRGFFENSYNIVTIKDGQASVDIKIVGGKRMPIAEIVEKYKPYL